MLKVRERFISYGIAYEPRYFNEIQNNENPVNKKPKGGLWACPCSLKYGWKEFVKSNSLACDFNKSTIFKFKDNAKIYKINSKSDLVKLLNEYGLTLKKYFSDIKIIDWEKVSKSYDAVYLTINGNRECHPIDYDGYVDLNQWDIPSVVVLNKDSIDIESIIGDNKDLEEQCNILTKLFHELK